LITLGSNEIDEKAIISVTKVPKEKMRTTTVQLNSDIYDRIEALASREGDQAGDYSKLMNELIALGLHHYPRSHLDSGIQ
jgi:hypothetical protein